MSKNSIIILSSIILLGLSSIIFIKNFDHNLQQQSNTNVSSSVPVVPINGKWITTKVESLTNVVILQLAYNGTDTWYISPNNPISKFLTAEFHIDTHNEFTVKIFDRVNTNRFTLPYQKPFPFNKAKDSGPIPNEYKYNFSKVDQEFYFAVFRAGNVEEPIFDTRNQNFMYSDKFMEISTSLNNNFTFGLGERRQRFRFKSGSYSFWAKDAATHNEDGQPDGQLYGTHPVYLQREKSNNFHIGFLRNAGGLLAEYVENERLTFRLTSSIIEFKYFLGDNKPQTVVKMYHSYVNGYSLHPFWSQGFHQCRYGYKSSAELLDVWNGYNQNNLPFDVLWSDIDYMSKYYDFTIDTVKFKPADLQQFSNYQGDKLGVRWVPIIDAGIAIPDASGTRGQELNIYIKSNQHNGDPLIGCVWPGLVYFPDFNAPNAQKFWTEGLKNITTNYNVTPAGIWIDMNEFANFVQGETVDTFNCPNYSLDAPQEESPEFLKLQTANRQPENLQNSFEVPFSVTGGHNMEEQTLSMDAYHYCGPDSPLIQCANASQFVEFEYHNLNGFGEGVATHNALKELGHKLPFIISRSTAFGSGAYVQHWTGDNAATWNDLYFSISEIFNFNLFGIPFVGADICGFAGNTTPELCARWMQLGALYPFARNHNDNKGRSQEPYAFTNDPYVLSSSRKSLQLRYSILQHYYSLFVKNNGLGTVFRPIFFEFPNDETIFDIDWEFMIGEALLAAPALIQGDSGAQKTTLLVTFPHVEVFFDYYTGKSYNNVGTAWLDVPFDSSIPLFLRSGYLIATQDVTTVLRSRDLNNKFNLKIALEKNSEGRFISEGFLTTIDDFSDDNIINKCVGTNNCITYINVEANLSGNLLQVSIIFKGENTNTFFETITIESIEIYGFQDFVGNYSNDIKQFFIYEQNVITKSEQEIYFEASV